MSEFGPNPDVASERVALAINTAEPEKARMLMEIAKASGLKYVFVGPIEPGSSRQLDRYGLMAEDVGVSWVADTTGFDFSFLGGRKDAVDAVTALDTLPNALAMSFPSRSIEPMERTQELASERGIAVLASPLKEYAGLSGSTENQRRLNELSSNAARAGLRGLVLPAQNMGEIESKPSGQLFVARGIKHIWETTSGRESQGPRIEASAAIRAGADLLVVDELTTKSQNPQRHLEVIIGAVRQTIESQGDI